MMIKNVLICGLGAVGLTYANKLKDICNLYILADEKRIEKYKNTTPKLNDKELELNYITPEDKENIDLIIISTKNDGLKSAIDYIHNYVGENTIIISLLNGISSETEIASVYGWGKVLHSYFIGHSAVRTGVSVTQDGIGRIVFGSPYEQNLNKVKALKEFFSKNDIVCEVPENIEYSMWLKYTMNSFSNQLSAILNINFGEMKHSQKFRELAKRLIYEIKSIAEKEGVQNLKKLEHDAFEFLDSMTDDGKSSMHQDILAKRKTEVDIFAGEIIKLGKKHGIKTPYSDAIYNMIKILEEKFN